MRLSHFPSAQAGRPLRQRRGSSRLLRRTLFGLGLVFAVLVLAVGVGAAILLSGPTEIGVLRDRVEAALQDRLGADYAVGVGRVVIDVDPVLGFVVEIDNVEVKDTGGEVVARAPATRIAVDPLALLRLKVSVSTIELADAEVSVVRSGGGQFYLGTAATAHTDTGRRQRAKPRDAPTGDDGGFPEIHAMVSLLDRGLEPQLRAAVRNGFLRFNLVGGTFSIYDAQRDENRRFPNTDATVAVDPTTGNMTANIAASGYGGRWTATVERTIDTTTGDRFLSAVFSQLSIADILPRLGEKDSLFTADIPLYGRGNLVIGEDGSIKDATIRIDVGAGVFTFGEMRETVLLDEATLKLRWDTANRVILIEDSPVQFGRTRGVVTGFVRPEGDPAARRYAFEVETEGALLAASDANEEPLVATRIAASGIADVPGKALNINDFVAITPLGEVRAIGTLGFEGKTPSLAMAANFSDMPARAVKQLWVPFIAPGARRWIMQHVLEGRVSAGEFQASIPPGILWNRDRPPIPDDALRLNVRLDDVAFTTFGDLPPVVSAAGHAVLAGSTFGVDLEKGQVKLPSGGFVDVTAGAFAVDDVFQRGTDGLIEVQMTGDAAALGEIANARPFTVLDRRDVRPSDLSGKADVSVSVRLPLRKGITEGDVDWRVNIAGENLASSAPVEGRTFSDANVTIIVTPDEVTVNGKAKIDGVPADVAMSQPITQQGISAGPGQQVARFNLDDAARKRLGIGLNDVLGGTVGALVSSLGGGQKGQRFDLDLKQARVVIPGVGWAKGIGVPAKLTFDLKPVENGFHVDNIELKGNGFGFSGSARLDSGHGLVSADITRFQLRQGDSLAFKLTRTKTGYTIDAKGSSFDVRGVIQHVKSNKESAGESPDMTVNAEVGKLIGFNDETLSNARLAFVSASGFTRKLALSGNLGNSTLSVALSDLPESASLRASASDAGAVLRFLDLYTRVSGGTLAINADRPGRRGALAGTFEVFNFDIVNEPAVANVVSTASNRDNPSGINAARLRFDRMAARFQKTDQAITIDEALLRSAVIGATFNGRIDLARSSVQINGTYIPAYAFNNAFSKIPLIGPVLSGGFREGLIGVTFKVDGPMDGPRIFVNPLSAVAPGIFRKIFEFR